MPEPSPATEITRSPAELIAEIIKLGDWIAAESKRFSEHMKPYGDRVNALKAELQTYLLTQSSAKPNEDPKASFSCSEGTAYLSTIRSYSIDGDKTKFLDWIEEDWDNRGDMLNIGAPYVDPVREWAETHEGSLPPHLKISAITKCNVRRS